MRKMITQGRSDKNCAGCVAVMICNTSLDDLFAFMGNDGPPFELVKIFSYLQSRGIVVGYHINYITPVYDDSKRLKGYKVDWQPAYVVVDATVGSRVSTHAIFWDGEKVWDPHYERPTFNLEKYKIVSWTPLYIPGEPCARNSENSSEESGFMSSKTTIHLKAPAAVRAQVPGALTFLRPAV